MSVLSADLSAPPSPVSVRSRLRLLLATFGLLVVLAVVMTWPQVLHLRTGVADVGDPLLNTWALSWVVHQAAYAPARIFDANIFHPERWTLAFSEPMLVPSLLSAPFVWLGAGPIFIYNLVFLSALVFSGLGTTLLVLELTGSTAGAIVAGIIFAFLPFRFDHYSHLQLQQTQWIPLTMWALHRMVTWGRRADAARLGLFAACQMLSCVYFGVFLMPYLAIAGMVLVAAEFQIRSDGATVALVANRHFLRRTTIGVIIAAIVYGVLVAPVGRAHMQASAIVGERSPEETKASSATPGDYLAAPRSNRLYGRWADVFGHDERRLFPGVVTVLLALFALSRPWTPAKVAYLVALLLAIDLSFGFNGLTYRPLFNFVTPFRGLRVPARMGLFAGFSLAVLAGYGIARLHGLIASPARRRGATVVIASLIVLESSSLEFGLTLMPTSAPPVYADLLNARGNAPPVAMVEFPLGQGPTYMYYSTFHWQNLLNGYSGFFPPSYRELERRTQSFPDEASLTYLRTRGVRFITVHSELMPPREYEQIVTAAAALPGLKLISRQAWLTGEISLYRLLSADGCETCDTTDGAVSGTVAGLTVAVSRPVVKRGAPIDITYTFTPTPEVAAVKGNYWVMAHFADADGRVAWIDDHQPPTPTSQWRSGEPVTYTRTVFAPEHLPLGPVTLQVGLYSPDTQARLPLAARELDGRAYAAASVTVDVAETYDYPSGWFDHEGTPTDPVRWRWTKQDATLVFPNPKADATLYIDADAFPQRPEPAHVTVRLGGRSVATFDVRPGVREIHRLPLTAPQFGSSDLGEAVISVDRTYSPAELSNGTVTDTRQLGIRVFNAAISR